MEDFIDERLKALMESCIEEQVDNMIKERVEAFSDALNARKDDFISSIMKGIRVYHEADEKTFTMNYRIIFENVETIKHINN